MIKKIFLISLLLLFVFIFATCNQDTVVNTPVHSTKGVLVLYEGGFIPGSGDYSFINTTNDSVFNSVFSNSNGGANLGLVPDGIYLSGQYLYVTSQGAFGGKGKMLKIRSSDNKLIDTSINFGVNPYDFDLANGHFFVTNTAGSSVTELDMSLNVVNGNIPVGPNPSKIIFAIQSLFVAKQSYTHENTLAIINQFSLLVTKDTFPAQPVSIANIQGGVHVSTYSWKKLYVIDSFDVTRKKDSVQLNIQSAAIGEIVSDGYKTLYVVGISDTTYQSIIGNKVYKYNVLTRQIDTNPVIEMSPPNDIYGITYDMVNSRIWIANSKGGAVNGEVRVYDTNGNLLKTYPIGGLFPRKFAFVYENQ